MIIDDNGILKKGKIEKRRIKGKREKMSHQ